MVNEKWLEIRKGADFQKIAETFHITPVLARIIRNREIIGDSEIYKYLCGGKEELYPAALFKDMEKAACIMMSKIQAGKRIRIINDYDVDGVCSGFILLSALKKCNAQVDIKTPNRITDGYGINLSLVEAAISDGVDTIVTCDNGISAVQAIEYAKDHGLTVIITDHHNVPYTQTEHGREYILPAADAIINPKQSDCAYPCKELCGASIAWKFIQHLFEKMGFPTGDAYEYIEFAGLATVCDVMSLTDENRIIVKEALKKLRNTKNIGLLALIDANKIEKEKLRTYHLGFIIGPCINASGRLDTAELALQLLMSSSYPEASRLAERLVTLNEERKDLTEKGIQDAIEMVETQNFLRDRVLVIHLLNCHESVAGIIAGKIREKYYRPTFILTTSEGGILKGSGRSIEEYSMYDEMCKIKDVFLGFGGHPMAAGLSIKEQDLDVFRKRINGCCSLSEQDIIPKVKIDVPLSVKYTTCSMVRELEVLEPYGKDNEKPVFADKNVHIKRARILGKNKNVLKCDLLSQDGYSVTGIYFGEVQELLEYITEKFGKVQTEQMLLGKDNCVTLNIVYDMQINEYQYTETPQVVIRKYC